LYGKADALLKKTLHLAAGSVIKDEDRDSKTAISTLNFCLAICTPFLVVIIYLDVTKAQLIERYSFLQHFKTLKAIFCTVK
jgi:hypothetical protein